MLPESEYSGLRRFNARKGVFFCSVSCFMRRPRGVCVCVPAGRLREAGYFLHGWHGVIPGVVPGGRVFFRFRLFLRCGGKFFCVSSSVFAHDP